MRLRRGLVRGFTGADVAEDTRPLSAGLKEVGLRRPPAFGCRAGETVPPRLDVLAKTKHRELSRETGFFVAHIPEKETEGEGGKAAYFRLS